MARVTIAHISDLHVGSIYFEERLLKLAIEEINGRRPDIVVVGGDLTNMGFRSEFEQVQAYLDEIECKRTMVVPGNHDARNVGYLHFERLFKDRYPVLDHNGVVLLGVDSSEPDLDEGRVGRQPYQLIRQTFAKKAAYKVFVLHHHLVSVPGTGRERNIVHDAGDVLEVLVEAGANMVLSGHKHVPYIWRLEDMLIVNAGSVSSRKLRGDTVNCYNMIEIDDGRATVWHKFPGGAEEKLVEP